MFKLVIVATKIGISPHISKNVRGLLLQGRKSLLCIVLDFAGFVELLFHRGVLVGELANGEIFYLVVGKAEVVVHLYLWSRSETRFSSAFFISSTNVP